MTVNVVGREAGVVGREDTSRPIYKNDPAAYGATTNIIFSSPPPPLPLPCFPCPFHTIFGAGIERKFNDVKYGIVSLRNDEGTFLNFVFK